MATKSEATRAKMFDAALELIAEKGFTCTTVDEIVERAGVAKGTVYYHFTSKTELVQALIAERQEGLVALFRTAVASTGDPSAKLEALVRTELEWIRDNRAFAKLLMTELWREERVWHESLTLLREEIVGYIRDAIAEGITAGIFRPDVDAGFAAAALFGMTATSALGWLVFEPEKPLETVLAQITTLASMAVREA